jgi:hypothetical protein
VRAKLQSSTIGTSSGVFIPVKEDEETNISLGLDTNFEFPTTFSTTTAKKPTTTLKNSTSWIRRGKTSRKERRN